MNRPKLSRERILETARSLVDQNGITGLSMRKLAAELGIEAMTLYYYFPNKDAILDGLIEQVVTQAAMAPVAQDSDWSQWLRNLAISLRAELLDHPRLLPLVATRPIMSMAGLEIAEKIVAQLGLVGFSPLQAFQVLNIITTFVIGHTLAEAGETPGQTDAVAVPAEMIKQLDPAQFPCFTTALEAGLGQSAEHQARFTYALDAIFIGLATLKTAQKV